MQVGESYELMLLLLCTAVENVEDVYSERGCYETLQ